MYPLCFGIRKTDIPDPLRVFQVTHFDKVDFHRLAVDLAERTRQGPDWTAAQQVAFEQSWLRLEASVGDALRRPDDGVHTTRGFIHEIAGGQLLAEFAATLRQSVPGLAGVTVAPDFVVARVFPTAGGERIAGIDLLNDPRPGSAAAVRLCKVVVMPPT